MKVRQVLRSLARRAHDPAIPAGGMLRTRAQRDDWQAWVARASAATSPEDVIARHPRADALKKGFAVGAYLTRNLDVADAVRNPVEAVFHYLEFGIPEGRDGSADQWNANFVSRAHGHVLPARLTAPQVAATLMERGIPAAEIALCDRDMWILTGLYSPALAKIFHHETYLAAVDAAGLPLPSPDRLSCIRHYTEIGLDAGLPAHPDHWMDPDFYRASLPGGTIPDDNLLRHWARIGLRLGAHANAQACALMQYGLRWPQQVPAASAAQIAQLVAAPLPMAEGFDATDPVIRSFLIDLARLKRHEGDAPTAEALLTRALRAAPYDARAAVELADLIHGTGQLAREADLRRIPPADFDSGANRVTLAELALAENALSNALDLAGTLPAAAQSDVALRRRARAVGRVVFDRLWAEPLQHVDALGLPAVQTLLARALALYAPPPDVLPRSGAIARVAILANDDLYQCKLYRADQKADQLRAQGHSVRIYLQSRDVAALHADLAQYDAVIFQRTPAFPHIADLMVDAARQGLATFYDIDDLIFDTAHFPPPLETYAGQIDAAQHSAIACGVPLFAAAAALCDVGIASTEPIRRALAPLTRSGTAFTHRNALGQAHMAAMRSAQAPENDKLVLFYGSGTKAHKAEFQEVLEPALARVLRERAGQVEIRLMGEFPDLTHLDPSHPDVTMIHPIWDFECYAAELSRADIALSALDRSPTADAKSELKWTEPAMFRIPAVVSPTPVMADAVENGVTGLLATGPDGFADAMLRLIDDPALRARIGDAAHARVMADYSLPVMGKALAQNMDAMRAPAKTKLLVVNVFYPPQDIGGATRVVADNVSHLLAHHGDAYEIDILTTLEGGQTPHEVQAVSHSGARIWAVTAADNVNEHAMSDPVMNARIDTLLDRITPDIVHVHCIQRLGAGIIDACRRRGIPYVLTLHDGWWASPHQFILGADGSPRLYDFHDTGRPKAERVRIARRCISDANACLAVSEPFAQLHRDIGLANVRALPNGVSSLPTRKRTNPPAGRVRLGLIGGAVRQKGYDILRAALSSRAYDNLDLLVVDHALPAGAEVAEVWHTTPVRRIPRQPQGAVGALYGSFDVLLAPSVWPESFGLVSREALALGLWVVASDRGAMGADITEGENGHVVSVDDHRALAGILAQIDADPARYTQPPATRPVLHTAAAQGDALAVLYADILADVRK